MADPELVVRCLQAMRDCVGDDVKVTLKHRIGINNHICQVYLRVLLIKLQIVQMSR